jgi:hypothetical protein
METRGWKSADMLNKAKRELLDAGLIFQTVQGHRPNKASWYACTWMPLDQLAGYDFDAMETFQRSAYRNGEPLKNAMLKPPHGTERPAIAPPHGTENARSVPPHGAIKGGFDNSSVPPHGHHLEKPSTSQFEDVNQAWAVVKASAEKVSVKAAEQQSAPPAASAADQKPGAGQKKKAEGPGKILAARKKSKTPLAADDWAVGAEPAGLMRKGLAEGFTEGLPVAGAAAGLSADAGGNAVALPCLLSTSVSKRRTRADAQKGGTQSATPFAKRHTRGDAWTPEKLAEMRAYREAHGLQATADHFGINRQRVCKLLPGMGKRRGAFMGRKDALWAQ